MTAHTSTLPIISVTPTPRWAAPPPPPAGRRESGVSAAHAPGGPSAAARGKGSRALAGRRDGGFEGVGEAPVILAVRRRLAVPIRVKRRPIPVPQPHARSSPESARALGIRGSSGPLALHTPGCYDGSLAVGRYWPRRVHQRLSEEQRRSCRCDDPMGHGRVGDYHRGKIHADIDPVAAPIGVSQCSCLQLEGWARRIFQGNPFR